MCFENETSKAQRELWSAHCVFRKKVLFSRDLTNSFSTTRSWPLPKDLLSSKLFGTPLLMHITDNCLVVDLGRHSPQMIFDKSTVWMEANDTEYQILGAKNQRVLFHSNPIVQLWLCLTSIDYWIITVSQYFSGTTSAGCLSTYHKNNHWHIVNGHPPLPKGLTR